MSFPNGLVEPVKAQRSHAVLAVQARMLESLAGFIRKESAAAKAAGCAVVVPRAPDQDSAAEVVDLILLVSLVAAALARPVGCS